MRHKRHMLTALAAALASLAMVGSAKAADFGMAVVPTQIIYPGQEITENQLTTVPVTNPNIAPGYAQKYSEVAGLVTTRTLLPNRTIMIAALREAWTVRRGDKIVLVYDNGGLKITAAGTPLNDGVVGDLIKVRNTDTGVIISGTVRPDSSILVVQK
ncbi:flagellar basal body P-ring formation chaperone FlgA [Rhizobium sp. SG_E_25_P2]|uniref:flagellar basal body P-ring formation chaperone FlgA n=1 Tax=Rhizobium sp. SG_E_25_P2 TaxID=2879942 RepID=UPI0024734C43|nr:flagellar basal body P-ring formation chaperone FlgA [Rhizobium sp. SG_E_25_P2]